MQNRIHHRQLADNVDLSSCFWISISGVVSSAPAQHLSPHITSQRKEKIGPTGESKAYTPATLCALDVLTIPRIRKIG
jgi:hypothetical protein